MTFPSKNHVLLLRALARLRDGYGRRLELICTGRRYEPHWPLIQAELEALRLVDQVRFLGPVPTDELHLLFTKARFLVFPSLFEGLGLPILEAFQHGLPVLAARVGSIAEVAGDAALYFDPRDEESITHALLEALRNPARLTALSARGAARLAQLSPAAMATRFVACYRFAAGAPLSQEQRALLSELIGEPPPIGREASHPAESPSMRIPSP